MKRAKHPNLAEPAKDAAARTSRRLIPLSEVMRRTSLSEATLWRLRRANQFPVFLQISKRRIGVWEDELDEWMKNRPPADPLK